MENQYATKSVEFEIQNTLYSQLDNAIATADSGNRVLSRITLYRDQFAEFKKLHEPDENGNFFYKGILIQCGVN